MIKLFYNFSVFLVLGAASLLHASSAVATRLPTPIETAGYSRISTSEEMSAFMHKLADRHPTLARIGLIGNSVQDRPIEAMYLASPPGGVDTSQRLKVMIVGTLHGAAEPAGGEALLVIAQDLLTGDLRPLLDNLDVILLPNVNPDGRDIRRRSNANQVNINIDFVLLSQPETRLLTKALNRYEPDAVLDSHESAIFKRETLAKYGYLTDFDAQFEIGNNPSVPLAMRDYALNEFLPALNERVSAGGLPAHRYIGEITSIKQPITNGGLTLRNFRNNAGMSGALSIMLETKLDSREDTFPTYRNIAVRIDRQLLCIRSFLTLVHELRTDIQTQTSAARAVLPKEALTLFAGYEVDTDNPTVLIPMRRLDTRDLEQIEFPDHRRQVNADVLAHPPMLVITNHQDKIRPVLDHHNVAYRPVKQAIRMEVIAIRVNNRSNIFERADVLEETLKFVDINPGALLIDPAQPNGRKAALLLDPRSISSIFRYPQFASLVTSEEEFFIYHAFRDRLLNKP